MHQPSWHWCLVKTLHPLFLRLQYFDYFHLCHPLITFYFLLVHCYCWCQSWYRSLCQSTFLSQLRCRISAWVGAKSIPILVQHFCSTTSCSLLIFVSQMPTVLVSFCLSKFSMRFLNRFLIHPFLAGVSATYAFAHAFHWFDSSLDSRKCMWLANIDLEPWLWNLVCPVNAKHNM